MIIIGAGGYALELLDFLLINNYPDKICFFDDLNKSKNNVLDTYDCLNSLEEVEKHLQSNKYFIIGFGYSEQRSSLFEKLLSFGGVPYNLFSNHAFISKNIDNIGQGNVIMNYCSIGPRVTMGSNCSLYHNVVITHDCIIGNNCEIAPNVSVLGRVNIGNNVKIGANATILPDVNIQDNVVVGAGAVVTKNINVNTVIAGVPAKEIKHSSDD